MDVRKRNCTSKIKIGVVEEYSNGLEDAIKPIPMQPHPTNKAYTDHAHNVIRIIKSLLPNAEIHLVPNTFAGFKHLIEQEVVLANVSLKTILLNSHKTLAEKCFIIVSAGNDGAAGEFGLATYDKACAVGAVNSNMTPMSYSSHGKGAVKTCAVTGLNWFGNALHGTSFASPVVVGLLGQWFAWHYETLGYYPSISRTNEFIKVNSHDIWDDGKDLRTGYGLLRLPHKFEATELVMTLGQEIGLKTKFLENEQPKEELVDLLIAPRAENGRTLVGLKGVFEQTFVDAHWDSKNQVVRCIR